MHILLVTPIWAVHGHHSSELLISAVQSQLLKDPVQAYRAPGITGAYSVSNKAGLDYSHDFSGIEHGSNLHVQTHRLCIFPTFSFPHFV